MQAGNFSILMTSVRLLILTLFAPVLLLGAGGEVEVTTEELPWAVIDRAYSPPPLEVRVSGRCPAGGVGFTVVSGALPPGLKLSQLGYFSGVPTRYGLFEFNVRAVTGCAWTARRFSLLVTEPPKLKAIPESVTIACNLGVDPPPTAIRITATWPQLSYSVEVTSTSAGGNWLSAIAEHGRTSRESIPRNLAEKPSDQIWLHFHVAGLKPGQYSAQVSVSAWQAQSVPMTVNLNVQPPGAAGPGGDTKP